MTADDLVKARRIAEEAVADMVDGPLKVKAFEVILSALLSGNSRGPNTYDKEPNPDRRTADRGSNKPPSSLAERINTLAGEGFLGEPRSLAEIQLKLAEHGWHYAQTNLSTPLIRLVRQRVLRRLTLAEGNKKVWKYSLP
jgi:hypothetical protein